jgi:hypothetical protein
MPVYQVDEVRSARHALLDGGNSALDERIAEIADDLVGQLRRFHQHDRVRLVARRYQKHGRHRSYNANKRRNDDPPAALPQDRRKIGNKFPAAILWRLLCA